LGDDLESFALVLLRLVGRHAPNNVERHNFLQRFVGFYGCYKSVMFGVGRAFVPGSNFTQTTSHICSKYRYTELVEREHQEPGKLEQLKHCQAQLESHKWFMDLLKDPLKAEE
jgi:hypothetical protein